MNINRNLAIQIAIGLTTGWVALGQASFEIYNHRVSSGVDAPVFDEFGNRLQGSNYRAELWGGAASDSLAPVLSYYGRSRVIIPFLTGDDAGYFRHLGDSINGDPSVFAVPPTGSAWLQIRAWDVRLGATYEEVVARGVGRYGESPLFYAQGGDPTLLQAGRPGRLIGLESFSLRPVPEPATWGLLAIGGLSIVFVMQRRG